MFGFLARSSSILARVSVGSGRLVKLMERSGVRIMQAGKNPRSLVEMKEGFQRISVCEDGLYEN